MSVEAAAGNPAATVNDAQNPYNVVRLRVPVNHDVGGNDADANSPPYFGARCAVVGKVREMFVKRLERGAIFENGRFACFGVKVVENGGWGGVSRPREDDPRHQRMAAKSASLRASCSSSVITSPRSTSAKASST